MKLNELRVALDGPSGAGKSTIAKLIAEKTGLIYVDTGALYRTVGLYAAEFGVKPEDKDGIIALLDTVDIKLTHDGGHQKVLLHGNDVEGRIRTEQASVYSSAVSKIPEVRAFLFDMQRRLADEGGVIMDGRDIGTVIMPDAEIKIFMTASAEERARRRHREQNERGNEVSYDEVLEAIIARDRQDSERDTAPLKPAEDAVIFDNGDYNAESSAEYIIDIMKKYIIARG